MDGYVETIEFSSEGFRIKSKIKISFKKLPLVRTQDYDVINKSLIDCYKMDYSIISGYHHTGWVFVIKQLSKNDYQHLTIKFPTIDILFSFENIYQMIKYAEKYHMVLNIDDYTVFPE